MRRLRLDYEHLQFDSGYEPRPEEPGRDLWLELAGNRTAALLPDAALSDRGDADSVGL